ncbi:MAG: hypothetical protein M1814_001768 [Vezdaea aestivalis]|nr:MAG: hypothetical protein M1814_001768 [Vezdaea aestivalis]
MVPWPAPPGLEALLPANASDEFFAYYNPECASSIQQALLLFEKYIAQTGPYDGVLGFSQGAALAAQLILHKPESPPFRCAVFLCGAQPCDDSLLNPLGSGTAPSLRWLDPREEGQMLHIPSLHVMGLYDPDNLRSRALAALCSDKSGERKIIEFEGGHEVPRAPKEVADQLVAGVRWLVDKADFMQ